MTMYALHSLVGVVDLIFVSSLGTEAVAAVGVAVQIHFFVFGVLAAVTTGTIAVVARETGGGSYAEAARAARTSVVLAGAIGAALMAAIPFAPSLVSLLGVKPAVAGLGGDCLRVLLAANVPFAAGFALSMALRGAGDVKTPLVVGIGINILNLVGDYALVFGELGAPALGALGSAIASAASMAIGGIALLALWRRDSLVLPHGPWWASLNAERSWRLLRVGLPSAAEQMVWQFGLFIFLALVAGYGTEPVSAYLIGVRILSFCFVPGLGFSTAASTLVGQHLGAGEPDLATRAGWRANRGAAVVMGGVGLVIILAAEPLARLFGAAGRETIDLTVTFIYILGAAQPLMAVEFALGGALRGAGDTRFPLVSILAGLFVFRLGAAVFVAEPLFGTVTAVWLCLLVDYTVKAVLLGARFASGAWKRVRV
jgi:putative MATE family efflux protein